MKFYKLKNGNISFEYEVKSRLANIEKLLDTRNNDLLCGVFGAVIANYITPLINFGKGFLFIPVMIGMFYIMRLLFRSFEFLIMLQKNHNDKDMVTDEEELQIQELFWDKIVSEIVYGVSLVNRVEELKMKNCKVHLQYIYALQAKRCFWEASESLNNSIYKLPEKKQNDFITVIGLDALRWVKDTSIEYLKRISNIYDRIDTTGLINFYNEMCINEERREHI